MKKLLLFLISAACLAAKQSSCTNADLFGAYGAYVSGFTAASPAQIVPVVSLGRFDWDGQGGFEGSLTSSIAGTAVAYTAKGTYSMKEDCTFTARLTNSLGQTTNYFGLYTVDEIRLNQLDGGAVAPVSMKPIARINGCTQADAEGSFAATVTGYVILGNTPVPFSNVAQVKFQGDAISLTGSAVLPPGGQTIRQAGKLTVSADCTAIAVARDQLPGGQMGPESKTYAVLVDRGREVFLMSIDANAVLGGIGRRQ